LVRVGFLWLPLGVLTGVVLIAAAHGQVPRSPLVEGEAPGADPTTAAPAQPTAPNSVNDGATPATSPAITASPLDTFLLRDSKGNLVPVLGMTFEEFEQLLRAKRGLAALAAPDFVLDSLSLAGSVDDQTANLQVTATIRVRSDGWVRVPLLMPATVVREPPKHEGPGEHFLAFDESAGGYVSWLKGNDSKPHVVTLQISVGLSSVGEEKRLVIAMPRATESSLRLTTAEPSAIATLLAGEGIVSTGDAASGKSEIAVLGPAGDLELAWRTGQKPVPQRTAQLDASGEILVRVESEHRITSDARLRLRSYGQALETFRVRLPPGMELVPISLAGYSLMPVLAPPAEAETPGRTGPGQVVEVRLDRPATAATEVRLLATLQADLGPLVGLMPAQFEVLGAVRQRGTIDFVVDGEWQLDWMEDRSVRRLDLAPDAANRAVARFEYFRQPCGLQLRVAARPSRVSVEPSHSVFVDSRQMRVKSMLKYRFRGARASKLVFELGEWKLLRLAPGELFELPPAGRESSGRVEIPLRPEAVLPTDLDVELEAYRPLPAEHERISLTFPRPAADIMAPASITISTAENVELTPLAGELVGLSADPSAARVPGRQAPALVYRDLGSGEPARFAAAVRTRPRLTTVSGRASVRLDRRQMQIEQRLEYRVAHEPQQRFALVAPRAALGDGNLQVWLNGEPLGVHSEADTAGSNGELARAEFSLPSEQIGTILVAVRYSLPLTGWDGQKPLALAIPLALPADEGDYQFTGQQIEFTLAEGMRIEPELLVADEFSHPAPINGSSSLPAFSWSRATPVTSWRLSPSQAIQAATALVERMWVQTWLAPHVRQERVVFQVRSQQETLRLRLPRGTPHSSVQVAVDGVEFDKAFRDPGQIIVNVPTQTHGRAFVLELYYSLDPPVHRLGLSAGQLHPAQIDGAAPPRRCYWQLALPESEHLVTLPRELSTEMHWDADRWLMTRRPALDEQQLQRWIGATRQEPLPRGANLYLFGGLGQAPALDLVAAHRRLIVATASGAILLVGLLLVHVPRFRSPSLLLLAAVFLAAGSLIAPDLAVLAGQGALLGLAIIAAAAGWTWFKSGRSLLAPAPVSTVTVRPRDSALAQSPVVVRPDRSSQITATASAAAVEVRP